MVSLLDFLSSNSLISTILTRIFLSMTQTINKNCRVIE